jgi:hypothetical protein
MWHPKTVEWWAALWAKPQAVMWDQSGMSLFVLACLYDDQISGREDSVKVSSEMRQHEDKHGLNPKAMLQLRWRIADAGAETTSAPAPSAERRKRLKVVG